MIGSCFESMSNIFMGIPTKSLADLYPELLGEWYSPKNFPLRPNELSPGSNKKVWWKCEKGHEWQATISHRTGKNKTACPYCSSRKATSANNLAVLFPDLLKEWNYQKNAHLKPEHISQNSHKKAWWSCSKGHDWQTAVVYRTRQKTGCPFCSGRLVCKDNCLSILFPEIAKEWHPTKNGKLTPEVVTSGSDRKVWWECLNGHEWQAGICNRTGKGKTGCPYCSGRNATTDGNLSILFPELLLEWHYEKNNPLKPENLRPGSNKRVWWKCSRGHEWSITPNKRTGKDATGCPRCTPQTSRIEIRIFCELKYLFSDIEWRHKVDGIEVDIYFPKYSIGIEVDGYYWHVNREEKDKLKGSELSKRGINLFRLREDKLRKIDETDIFFRNNEEELLIIYRLLRHLLNNVRFNVQDQSEINEYLKANSLQNNTEYQRFLSYLPSPPPEYSLVSGVHKHLISEWHYEKNAPLNPENFTPGTRAKLWWKCAKGHEWQAAIVTRTKGGGCPYCSGKKVSNDNNLAIQFPNLMNEWDFEKNSPLTPNDVYCGSTKKFWWKCAKGHEWQARVYDRTRNQSGCLYCAGKLVNDDNCLQTLYPDLSNEWHPSKNGTLTPKDVIPGSHKKAWWICDSGHEWQSMIDNRSRHNSGCPYCAGLKATPNNNLFILFPGVAKEWHYEKNTPFKPEDFSPQSNKKVWWKCANGHAWEAFINNRTGKNKTGCPYCHGRYGSEEYNLAVKYPELLGEWHSPKNFPLRPDELSPGSNKKVWWKCTKGHEWKTMVIHRTKRKTGCPYCAGQKVSSDNNLAVVYPEIASQWNLERNIGIKPEDVTSKSGKKVWWKCSKGHEWEAVIGNRTASNNQCPYCSGRKKSHL